MRTPLLLCFVGLSLAWRGAPGVVRAEGLPASDPPATTASLSEALREFNAAARFPLPTLSAAQIERLDGGKVVKIRQVSDDPDQPQRAIGLVRAQQPPAHLWLSLRDVHFAAVDELVEVQLTPPGQWPAVWYQHLDLPRPFSDRHWVVDVSDSHALASATGGRCWEHSWVLAENGPQIGADAVVAGKVPGIDVARAQDAIYTPANHGAWLVIDLGDGSTILGYHVTSVIGGSVPDKLVADYTLLTLGSMMRRVVARTPDVVAHYLAGHAPIQGGDGAAVVIAEQ